ncbi:MAG: hypothetical protein SPJ77_00490, partial [Eubacteriales bacterium]|nr:hypothetical protein [Eubacteriales bacterium]
MSAQYAGVYLLDAPFSIDREYDYRIPEGMSPQPGDYVSVPFGSGNRRVTGVCTVLRESSDTDPARIKPLFAVCSRELSLDGEMLGLMRFMKEQTLCTTGDAIHAMLPPAALSKLTEFFTLSPAFGSMPAASLGDADCEKLGASALMVLDFIREHGRVSLSALTSRFGAAASDAVAALCEGKKPLVIRELEPSGTSAKLQVKYCEPALPPDEIRAVLEKKHPTVKRPSSALQISVLEALL